MELSTLQLVLLSAPVLLFSMVAHEYAHGYAALKQGDPTAYQLGRLTWNPVAHIDPFMTVILPLITFFVWHFPFGGAKPIPVVPRNFRSYRRGDIIVSLAGVATNLVLAVLCTLLMILTGIVGRHAAALADPFALVQAMLYYGVLFNVLLTVFNLMPIPPLDGSHVVKHLLPASWAARYQQVGAIGLVLVFFLASAGWSVWGRPVTALVHFAMGWAQPFLLQSRWVF